jgi:hypothetical protein
MLPNVFRILFGSSEPQRFALAELHENVRERMAAWSNPASAATFRDTNEQALHITVSAEDRTYRSSGGGPKLGLALRGTSYRQNGFWSYARDKDGIVTLTLGEEITPEGSRKLSQNATELKLGLEGSTLVLHNCKLGGQNFRPDARQLNRLFDMVDFFNVSRLQGQPFQPVKDLLFYFEDHSGLTRMAAARQDHLLDPPPPAPADLPGAKPNPA